METDPIPLGVRDCVAMTQQQRRILEKIDDLDTWFVEERVLRKTGKSAMLVTAEILEFKRFLALTALEDEPLGMMSTEVDEVWHAFILFTREYMEFCQSVFGRYLHHAPRTSRSMANGEAGRRFMDAYRKTFGVVPAVWQGRESDEEFGELLLSVHNVWPVT